MHKFFKEKHDYTIIIWKELHQYPMNKLAAHGDTKNRLCRREIHPKKLI
jgi:hypothetical protein